MPMPTTGRQRFSCRFEPQRAISSPLLLKEFPQALLPPQVGELARNDGGSMLVGWLDKLGIELQRDRSIRSDRADRPPFATPPRWTASCLAEQCRNSFGELVISTFAAYGSCRCVIVSGLHGTDPAGSGENANPAAPSLPTPLLQYDASEEPGEQLARQRVQRYSPPSPVFGSFSMR